MKSLGKFKVWGDSKSANAKNANTTDEFRRMQQEIHQRADGLQKVHQAAIVYYRQLEKRKPNPEDGKKLPVVEGLGTCWSAYSISFPSDSPFASALSEMGRTHERMGALQLEFARAFKEGFLDKLEVAVADMKEYQALCKKLESRRSDLESKTTKLQKAKKENPQLEQDLLLARQKFEETEEDVGNKMRYILECEEQYHHELTSLVNEEINYYRSVTSVLESLVQSWPEAQGQSLVPQRPVLNTQLSKSSTISKPSFLGGKKTSPAVTPGARISNPYTHGSGEDTDDDYFGNGKRMSGATTPDRTSTYSRSNSTSYSQPSTSGYGSLRGMSRTGSTTEFGNAIGGMSGITIAKRAPSQGSLRSSGEDRSSASRRPSVAPRKQVKALFDFDATNSDELSFAMDEIITVVEEIDAGWWRGEVTDSDGTVHSGIFPVNYTEEVAPALPPMPKRPGTASRTPSVGSYHQTSTDDPKTYIDHTIHEHDEEHEDSPFNDLPSEAPRAPSANFRKTSSTYLPVNMPAQSSSFKTSNSIATLNGKRAAPPPPPSAASRPTMRTSRSAQSVSSSTFPRSRGNSFGSSGGTGGWSNVGGEMQSATQVDAGSCGECGCNDYSPNLFKKGHCNNCFHKH